jgi:hypothetical protein
MRRYVAHEMAAAKTRVWLVDVEWERAVLVTSKAGDQVAMSSCITRSLAGEGRSIGEMRATRCARRRRAGVTGSSWTCRLTSDVPHVRAVVAWDVSSVICRQFGQMRDV